MNVPPPMPTFERPRKNNLSTILIIISLSCILICGVLGYMGYNFGKKALDSGLPIVTCSIDIKAVRDGIVEYAKEKGSIPAGPNWQDEVRERVQAARKEAMEEVSDAPFNFPFMKIDGHWGCEYTDATGKKRHSTFVLNEEIAGKKYSEIVSPSTTLAIFEVDNEDAPNIGKFDESKLGKGPDIFGESRKWAKINLEGGTNLKTTGKSSAKISVE